ncbi:MAG: NAD(P)H-hydrate dehydratase [Pseudohongiellaceae bacterium]
MSASQRPVSYESLRTVLASRALESHKGSHGHVVVLGGAPGFGGAVLLAAEAAVRSGAGLVSVLTDQAHLASLLARRPELMVHAADSTRVINAVLERANVIVAGPGLGKEAWGQRLLQVALTSAQDRALPAVLDADALNLLADNQVEPSLFPSSKWILTPHPGEAARLLGLTVSRIQADREAAVRALQQRYGGTAILKGAGTLVCFDQHGRQQVDTCVHGNPGMASGGMGDVLSGVTGALLAQGLSVADAARLGVCLHSKAADLAAGQLGERGLLASDLFPFLRALLNP